MTWITAAEQPISERLGPYLVECGLDPYGLPIYMVATWDGINGVWRCEDGGIIATVKFWTEITAPEAPQ